MKKLWTNIVNHGVNPDNLDWDNRNIRFMNSMAAIMAGSMIFFSIMATSLGIYEDLPLIAIAFFLCCSYFIVFWKLSLQIAKFYFSITPLLLVAMFSILVVGDAGNDKLYIFSSFIVPLVLFRKKKHYLPMAALNIVTFFLVGFIQKHYSPWTVMNPDELHLYKAINILMVFVFIYALLHLFKNEIFGYQLEIEQQKDLIEEKNKEVTESIEYAKKIQEAILPPDKYIATLLPKSFILYKPKDIVAGDFYWMDKQNGKILFAVADCTGHGVPGAMVSVVCHNALHRSVQEFKLDHPAAILNKTRDLVVQTFSKSERDVKDGMDIALCAYDLPSRKLEFSGANNGLYLLRNGEVQEIKPNKEPIGSFHDPKPFTNHKVDVLPGDLIYLFTDGFADQFGGIKGKKYKYKPFKEFLLQLQNTPIDQHKELIDSEFEKWKGSFEQVDDVCIMGVAF